MRLINFELFEFCIVKIEVTGTRRGKKQELNASGGSKSNTDAISENESASDDESVSENKEK